MRSQQLLEEWGQRIDDLREDATARKILGALFDHPVISSDLVSERLSVSERTGRAALSLLADRGILAPYDKITAGPERPRHFWLAFDFIAMITGWDQL